MTPGNRSAPGASIVEALRSESRYRTWFATVLATTIAVVYLGSSFPFYLDQFPTLQPVGHFVSALILFAISLAVVGVITYVAMESRRRWSGVTSLRAPSVRRMLRELNRAFDMRVVAVTFGGGQDGRILAMRIKDHNAVGIGRGALSLIRREPSGFRYRLAHEYAHLAVGDPRRDYWLSVVYATTMLFLLIAYGSALSNTISVLVGIGAFGGWPEVKKALLGRMQFGFIANLVLFGSILLVLMLERRSAARLREFYADAVATTVVGPVEQVFSSAASGPSGLRRLWSRFLERHPEPAIRAAALADRGSVYRADMMLFVLQGFFSAFILEMVLQLMFTSASTGLATFDDRRVSLWRYFAISEVITSGTIMFGALLALTAHVLVLTRLAATVSVSVDKQQTLRLITSVPLFTSAGTFVLLATSQGILWDLEQTGWNLPHYIVVGWDRLTMHGVALTALCAVTISVFLLKPSRNFVCLVLGPVPVLVTLLLGYLLYR
jgi:hypothetical protein